MFTVITMIKKIFKAFDDILRFFIIYMPGSTGRKLRYYYWRKKFKKCGKNVLIDEGVIIQGAEYISIGDNVWIDKYCVLMAGQVNLAGRTVKRKRNASFKWEEGELIIEDNVHIAPNCILQAHGGLYIGKNSGFSSGVKVYTLSNLPNDPNDFTKVTYFTPLNEISIYYIGPVVIDENVGVALNSCILPGVTIQKNSFIGPFSLILTSFKENSYISGNPARRIKDRFQMEAK
jgi:galactoside O-acetyltransferase